MGEIQNIGTVHLQHMGREAIIAETKRKQQEKKKRHMVWDTLNLFCLF
jgi:UDP-N-acetylmuramyl pentapeptide synthase